MTARKATPSGVAGPFVLDMPDGNPARKPTARGVKRYCLVLGSPTSPGRWIERSSDDLATIRRVRRGLRHLAPVVLDRETGSLV